MASSKYNKKCLSTNCNINIHEGKRFCVKHWDLIPQSAKDLFDIIDHARLSIYRSSKSISPMLETDLQALIQIAIDFTITDIFTAEKAFVELEKFKRALYERYTKINDDIDESIVKINKNRLQ